MKMRLTKAPTLQKLLVVTLLTLTGLGFPPPLTNAAKCYQCSGQIKPFCSGTPTTITCPGKCYVQSVHGTIEKDCSDSRTESIFDCIQRVLSQTGSCYRINSEEFHKISKCIYGGSSSRASGGKGLFENLTSSADGRQGGPDSSIEVCLCDTDLCNTNSLLGSGPGPVGPGGGGSKIKCYCENQGQFPDVDVSCAGNGEVECAPKYEACHLIKGSVGKVKGCDKDGFYGFCKNIFKCVQDKYPGTSGHCVKGTPSQLNEAAKVDCKSSGGLFSTRDGGDQEVEICTCKTDLCNSGGGSGSSGTGQGLLAGRNLIQVGITAAMITLLLAISELCE